MRLLIGFFLSMFRIFFSVSLFFIVTCTATFAAPSAQDFGALPNIHDAALSPDGSEIAVLVNNKGQYVVRVSKLDDMKNTTRLIGLDKKMKPEYLKWVNNKRVIISFWQREKIFDTPVRSGYLFSLDTDTMKGKILISPHSKEPRNVATTDITFRQFNNIVVDWLEDDPDHILMSYGDNNNQEPDLQRVNVTSGRDVIVKRGLNNVQTWYTDLRGEPRIGQGRQETDGEWVLRIRDADEDKWRFSDEFPGLQANVDIHGFTSNTSELIISAYQGKDTIGLYIYDLDEKNITRKLYHNDTYDASGVVLSADGGEVIGARYVSDSPQTEMLSEYDTIMSRMRSIFEGSTVSSVDRSNDGERTLFKVSNSTDPGYLMIVERGGDPVSLGPLYPHLRSTDLGVVVSVNYTARDGEKIPSFVTIPPAITDNAQFKGMPFIVLPHGGPYARDSKRFDYFAQFFASRGYGVLQMNFRGSSGYGKTFKNSGRENWVVMQEDVEDGTRWLIENGYADPKRICIVGWSYGGYAALMGAAKNPDLYSCAVSIAGLTDIKDFINDREKYRFGKHSMNNFIGKGFEDKDDIKANSPVKIADQMTLPIFLAHGRRDQVVHFDQYSRMKSALKKSSAKVTAMEFTQGDHYLSNQQERQEFLAGLEKFLKKVNGKSEFMK